MSMKDCIWFYPKKDSLSDEEWEKIHRVPLGLETDHCDLCELVELTYEAEDYFQYDERKLRKRFSENAQDLLNELIKKAWDNLANTYKCENQLCEFPEHCGNSLNYVELNTTNLTRYNSLGTIEGKGWCLCVTIVGEMKCTKTKPVSPIDPNIPKVGDGTSNVRLP